MGLVRGGPSTQKFDDVVKVQAGFAFGDGEQGELRVAGAEGEHKGRAGCICRIEGRRRPIGRALLIKAGQPGPAQSLRGAAEQNAESIRHCKQGGLRPKPKVALTHDDMRNLALLVLRLAPQETDEVGLR